MLVASQQCVSLHRPGAPCTMPTKPFPGPNIGWIRTFAGGGCSTRAKSSHTTRAVLPARNEPQTGHDTGGRSCCNEAQRRTSSVIISSNSTMFSGPEQNIFSAWQKGIYLPPKCQRCALTHGGRLAVDYHRTVQAACTYVYLDVVYVRGGVCARVTLLWCPLCLSAQPWPTSRPKAIAPQMLVHHQAASLACLVCQATQGSSSPSLFTCAT